MSIMKQLAKEEALVSARNVVLVDLDDTLSDTSWREHLIKSDGWDAFHNQLIHDQPCEDIVRLINMIAGGSIAVIGITGRPERYRDISLRWLLKHNIWIDELLMRPNDDRQKAPKSKMDLITARFGPDWAQQILCFIDNREDIIKEFNKAGVTGLLCHVRRS